MKETNEDMRSFRNFLEKDDDNDSDSGSDSEEEMSDESDNDGYDRGNYYRDGKYERKTSPMMSPINHLEELSGRSHYRIVLFLFESRGWLINYVQEDVISILLRIELYPQLVLGM